MPYASEFTTITGNYTLFSHIPTRRVSEPEQSPPLIAPPYSSLIEDAFMDGRIHKYHDELRQIALHPVKLHAGQSSPPNGELGRYAARNPVLLPEMTGGDILQKSI